MAKYFHFAFLTVVPAVIVSTAAQFRGLVFGDISNGLGGLGGGKPSLRGLGDIKPGKSSSLLFERLGGLGDLYRYQSAEDKGLPYYDWENAPRHN